MLCMENDNFCVILCPPQFDDLPYTFTMDQQVKKLNCSYKDTGTLYASYRYTLGVSTKCWRSD